MDRNWDLSCSWLIFICPWSSVAIIDFATVVSLFIRHFWQCRKCDGINRSRLFDISIRMTIPNDQYQEYNWCSSSLNRRHSIVNTVSFYNSNVHEIWSLSMTRISHWHECLLLIVVRYVLKYWLSSTSVNSLSFSLFDSYLRSETNSYLMFISIGVNWTWWRRASFYLKAFPVLIKQVSTN